MLSYLGVWSLGLFSPTFFSTSSKKKESFGCAKKNTSGPMLKNIQKQVNVIYLNNDEHTHMDRSTGNTDLPDMALVSPNPAKRDTQFQIRDYSGSDHLSIEI